MLGQISRAVNALGAMEDVGAEGVIALDDTAAFGSTRSESGLMSGGIQRDH